MKGVSSLPPALAVVWGDLSMRCEQFLCRPLPAFRGATLALEFTSSWGSEETAISQSARHRAGVSEYVFA